MALKGGSADKAGNNYENYWTTNVLCHFLLNYPDCSSIYFEKPDEVNDGFEFSIYTSGKTEHYQVKNYQKNWTCASLCTNKIISNFFNKIKKDKNAKCIFLSCSNSSIQELIDRAKRAISFDVYFTSMLSNDLRADIELILREVCNIEFPEFDFLQFDNTKNEDIKLQIQKLTYNLLRKTEYRVIDEISLNELNTELIASIFKSPTADNISDGLFRFSQENYNKKYTKSELINYLQSVKNYTFSNYALDKSLVMRINEHVKHFISSDDYFYKNYLIVRHETEQIIDSIKNEKKFIFLTGNAGCGKSIILKEVCKYCIDNSINVLPINIRDYDNINNCQDLGECIYNKKESPLNILVNISQGRSALIVIDQLDALSTVSGRNINKWQIINKILNDAKAYSNIKVVVACRSFDLERDSRFSNFRKLNNDLIKIVDSNVLPEKQVKELLLKLGMEEKNICSKTISLFSLPLHLKLLSEILTSTSDTELKYLSKVDLFDAFWNAKRINVGSLSWVNIIKTMVNYLNKNKTLIAPSHIFDNFQDDFEKMISNHVFYNIAKNKVAFFHETFFDYCFARIMTGDSNNTLEQFIINSDQSLFIRSNVRQTLEFLRINDFNIYLDQVSKVLNNENIRIHLKLLVLDLLCNFASIHDDEIQILASINSRLNEIIYKKPEYYYLIFLTLFKNGELLQILKSSDDKKINFCYELVRSSIYKARKEVLSLFEELTDDEIVKLISNDKNYMGLTTDKMFFENERLYKIILKALTDGILHSKNYLNLFIYNLKETNLTLDKLFDIFIIVLKQETKDTKKRINLPKFDEIIEHTQKNPELFLDRTFDVFIEILNQNKIETKKTSLIYDKLFMCRIYNFLDSFIILFKSAIEQFSKQNPDNFWNFFEKYSSSNFETVQFLLLSGLSELPQEYADRILKYVIDKPELLKIGYSSDSCYLPKLLINKYSSNCSDEILEKLLSLILNRREELEYKYFFEIKTKKEYKNYSPIDFTKGAFLSAFDQQRLKTNILGYKTLQELQRKFGKHIHFKEPSGIEGGIETSPLPRSATEKMTNEQWINAIYKFQEKDFNSGSAFELSRELERIIKLNPERFIDFIYLLEPQKTNVYYYEAILRGLTSLTGFFEAKEKIVKYCFGLSKEAFSYGIIDVIDSIINESDVLSQDLIDILIWLATKHSSPDKQLNDNFDFDAINCTRGRAVRLIGEILNKKINYLEKFDSAIKSAIGDILPVKASCAFLLFGIYNNNREYALNILKSLVESNPECLCSNYIQDFIRKTRSDDNFEYYKRLFSEIDTENGEIKAFIGQYFCNFALFNKDAILFAEKYVKNADFEYRRGCAKLFSAAILEENFIENEFVKKNLFLLIDDENDTVAETAIDFIDKSKAPQKLLKQSDILKKVLDSRCFLKSRDSLLYNLKSENITSDESELLRLIILKYIEKTELDVSSTENRLYINSGDLFELILKFYEITPKEDAIILDILDNYLSLPTYTYKEKFNHFERTL